VRKSQAHGKDDSILSPVLIEKAALHSVPTIAADPDDFNFPTPPQSGTLTSCSLLAGLRWLQLKLKWFAKFCRTGATSPNLEHPIFAVDFHSGIVVGFVARNVNRASAFGQHLPNAFR
jgi:hypothetical protein